jgi:hypothetical protein
MVTILSLLFVVWVTLKLKHSLRIWCLIIIDISTGLCASEKLNNFKLCQLISVHVTRRAVSRARHGSLYSPDSPQMIIDITGHNSL